MQGGRNQRSERQKFIQKEEVSGQLGVPARNRRSDKWQKGWEVVLDGNRRIPRHPDLSIIFCTAAGGNCLGAWREMAGTNIVMELAASDRKACFQVVGEAWVENAEGRTASDLTVTAEHCGAHELLLKTCGQDYYAISDGCMTKKDVQRYRWCNRRKIPQYPAKLQGDPQYRKSLKWQNWNELWSGWTHRNSTRQRGNSIKVKQRPKQRSNESWKESRLSETPISMGGIGCCRMISKRRMPTVDWRKEIKRSVVTK